MQHLRRGTPQIARKEKQEVIRKSLLAMALLLTLVLGGAATAAASLVNVHIHGLSNTGRTQVHIHNVVHNVSLDADGTARVRAGRGCGLAFGRGGPSGVRR